MRKNSLIPSNLASNKVEKLVIIDANNHGTTFEERLNYLQDVTSYGCQSGTVSRLIYYTDTKKFYNTHKSLISEYVVELEANTGESFQDTLNNFDDTDPLILEDSNKNLLSWFAYEEAANRILGRLEVDDY